MGVVGKSRFCFVGILGVWSWFGAMVWVWVKMKFHFLLLLLGFRFSSVML